MKPLSTIAALLLSISLPVAATDVCAQTITPLGDLPGGAVSSSGTSLSPTGAYATGYSQSANGQEAFLWSGGVLIGIGDLPGGSFYSTGTGISDNGQIIVGTSSGTNGNEAFRWVQGVGMTGLGDLAGGIYESSASDVNADGTVVVGYSMSANGFDAFRWVDGVGMLPIGDLAGGTYFSTAAAVTPDGNIVVGLSNSANGNEAYRWTNGVGMIGLGDLAGGSFYSAASDVTPDGTVVVGYSESANGIEAFRWVDGVGMTGLGDLPGGIFLSIAADVDASGTIVVGGASGAGGNTAFIWRDGVGMEALSDVLQNAGIDLTGWTLTTASDISDDGNFIIGNANLGGNTTAFIANLSTGGITTPANLVGGLIPALAPSRQVQGAFSNGIDQSLFAATQAIPAMPRSLDITTDSTALPADISPASGQAERTWSGYAAGSFGIGHDNDFDNRDVNGTTGIMVHMTENFTLGAGIIGSSGTTETSHGGDSSLTAKGGSMIASYAQNSGLRFYGTAFVAHLDLETDRAYANGAGTDTSHGETSGLGYGAAARLGWYMPLNNDIALMPYAELQATQAKIDGYTERDGPFPASFGDQKSHQVTSRLGTQLDYAIAPDLSVGGRVAWAHRLSDTPGRLNVSTAGLTGTLEDTDGDKNWMEGSVSTNWTASPSTRIGAELTGRSGKVQEPALTLTLGATLDF